MRECSAAIAEQKDYLTQLDAAIGDADHGSNMTRGFAAVETKLDQLDGGTPPGKVLVTAGQTLVSTVGGASGPLWGTALRRAGKALGDADEVDPAQLGDALEAAVAGVVELGAAQPGEKTMVDALQPAVDAYRTALELGVPLLARALSSAARGQLATVPQIGEPTYAAKLGRDDLAACPAGVALSRTAAARRAGSGPSRPRPSR